jgi:hypothetical protein
MFYSIKNKKFNFIQIYLIYEFELFFLISFINIFIGCEFLGNG